MKSLRKASRWLVPFAALAMTVPAHAQDGVGDIDPSAEVMEALTRMFVAEPLTPEQETRLPAASAAVGVMMPEGFYGEMMGNMMDQIIEPMFDSMGGKIVEGQIKKQVGLYSWELPELDEQQLEEISGILDPVAEQRMNLLTTGMIDGMIGMFTKLEPAMREGMSRAYAVKFSEAELADINAFFATPSGNRYASESMMLMADPQVMSGMMQSMPAIMEEMPALMAELQEQEKKLPSPKGHGDLTSAERIRLAELLGITNEELEARMVDAAAEIEGSAEHEDTLLVEED